MATRISATSSALKATKHSRNSLADRLRRTSQSAGFILSSETSCCECSQTSIYQQRHPQPPTHRFFHTSPSRSSSSAAPKYSYRIAASFTAKDSQYNPTKNIFNFNPFTRIQTHLDPKKKSKRPDSGQDAFFVSRIGESNDVALGVCDGVGGWVTSGVDPADFSHGICGYMAEAAYNPLPTPSNEGESKREWTPQRLMQRGYDDICNDTRVRAGGSTACVAIAKSTGDLEVANLGDSGFVQLRLNAIHNYSEPQTHDFNTPYQLSLIPGKVRARAAAFGGYQLHDMPADAGVTKHTVRHGDVLIFASDGVWDNLSAQSILQIVSKLMIAARAWEHTSEGISVGQNLDIFTKAGDDEALETPSLQSFLAVGITGEAKAASVNSKVDGPFAREVQRYFPEEGWRGGKVDDICVVVAVVVEEGK